MDSNSYFLIGFTRQCAHDHQRSRLSWWSCCQGRRPAPRSAWISATVGGRCSRWQSSRRTGRRRGRTRLESADTSPGSARDSSHYHVWPTSTAVAGRSAGVVPVSACSSLLIVEGPVKKWKTSREQQSPSADWMWGGCGYWNYTWN